MKTQTEIIESSSILRSFMICSALLTKYYLSDSIKDDEMAEACHKSRGDKRCIQVWWVILW